MVEGKPDRRALDAQVIVVGAGLAGIAMSRYLSRGGISNLVLEKSSRAGGIWSRMDWPGIRCDTEILNYSYSFGPFVARRHLVPGRLIAAYLRRTANESGVTANTRFDTRVERAEFDSREAVWTIHTDRGSYRSQFLVNANGYFEDRPYEPGIAGRDEFPGEVRHLFDLHGRSAVRGKRVILVGSGASAISAAPVLAQAAASLTLLQRSPSYIYEQNNRIGPLTRIARRLHRAGFGWPLEILRYSMQLQSDLVFVVFRAAPALGRLFFRRHWKNSVDAETLARDLTPRYNPWEQRIAVAVGLKKLLEDDAIQLVTGEIERFEPRRLRLLDGRLIEADCCILATGFVLNFFRFPILVDNQPIDTRRINFFKGMMMGGIPNYFQPFGPSHTSFTGRIEAVARLVVRILEYLRQRQYDRVAIDRAPIAQQPRITPGYVMRSLDRLPATYGSLELPSLDNLWALRFRPRDYRFSRIEPEARGARAVAKSATPLGGTATGR